MKMNPFMHGLRSLYEANPRVFKEFVRAFSSDLGLISAPETLLSFSCPNCNARIDIAVSKTGTKRVGKGRSKNTGRRSPFSSGTLNPLVLKLARLRGVMVGAVHADFTKALGKKGKALSKEDYRKHKVSWLRKQIAVTFRRKRSKAA